MLRCSYSAGMRWFYAVIAACGAMVAAVIVFAFFQARAMPVVRRTTVAMRDWPAGARPIRVALVSDIHIESAAMSPARLARIVAQVNAAKPDLVMLAGDFINGEGEAEAARSAPLLPPALSRLRAPLGVIGVPGNHDWATDIGTVRAALARGGVTLLANQAVVRGPLAIGGLDDNMTNHDRMTPTLAALRALPGARIILSHSPDPAADLPADVTLLMAGHTHCGQVVLPLLGVVVNTSHYGRRFLCGIVREGPRTVIIGAGVGTSDLPLRLGAVPDWWLVTLGPRADSVSRPRP